MIQTGMIFRLLTITFFIFFLGLVPLYSQEKKLSPEEMNLEAKAFSFFKEEKFAEALPLMSQLLSMYPKEPGYNFGYAVCLIETNQETEKAIKYLQYAESKSDNPLVKYYIGRAYHLNYKFEEAIANYSVFASKATPPEKKKYSIDNMIAMCNNGKELIRYISDLTVIDNKKIKNENYFYSYELKDFGGKLIIKPPEFKSKIDKKLEPSNTVIFFPTNAKSLYYGSYGDKNLNGRDIYKIQKDSLGQWGKPVNAGSVLNTPFDEDFPFLQADGITLFFSSKGHNSMGGYDIFKSVFDTINKVWTKPINLDFPINTPYDDFLFVPDKEELYAFFASNRETNGDKISVYKIIVDKQPIEREFNNLEEIINTSKLEVSPLADIKKVEDSRTDLKNNQLLAQNNSVSNKSNKNTLPNTNLNYTPLTYTADITSEQISTEVAKDVEVINSKSAVIRKQSDMAYLEAEEKNKLANDKRKLASDNTEQVNKISETALQEKKRQEIFNLITEAEAIEQEAITAYNAAKNLDQIATDMEKDVSKTKNLYEAINVAGNSNNESLVEAVNKNKERLYNSQNKYSSLDNEITSRSNLANEKQTEFSQIEKDYLANLDDVTRIEQEVSSIKQQIDSESDNAKKTELLDVLKEKDKQLDESHYKDSVLAEKYDKTKLLNENLIAEVSFLKNLKNKVETDNRSSADIALLTKNMNKDQLQKDIFNKELTADVKNVNTVSQNSNQNNKNNELTVQNNNNTTITNNNVENNTVKNNTVENNVVANNTVENNAVENNAIKNNTVENNVVANNNAENNTVENNAIKNNTVENNVIANNTIENNTVENNTVENNTIKNNTVDSNTVKNNTIENTQTTNINNNLTVSNVEESKTNNVYKSNPVFPFSNDDNKQSSKLVSYQKEVLNSQYYGNLAKEQEKQLEILNNALNNISDVNTKLSFGQQVKDLTAEIDKNKSISTQSSLVANKLRSDAVSEVDTSLLTNEQLVLNATQYQPKNNLKIENEQQQTLTTVKNNRETLTNVQRSYKVITANISDLEKESGNSAGTQGGIEKDLINKRIKQKELINEIAALTNETNQNESGVYTELIKKNREINASNPDLRFANMLEKESEIYFETASNIRKDATLREKPEEMKSEYQKADNIEQIAIQKQKYALDLYISSKKLVADNNQKSAFQTDSNIVKRTSTITLNADEEQQLKTYRQESHKSDVMIAEAKSNLADVEAKRIKALASTSTAEKTKILKGVDEKEQKSQDLMLTAYQNYGKADSMKYLVYKDQIIQFENADQNNGKNKLNARQYTQEADFYFSEASGVRQKALNITNKYQKITELQRATELEKKALTSQELAVDILTDVNPVFFVSTNDLTKVDRLDVLNQPVDVSEISKVNTSRIVPKLNLTNEDQIKIGDIEKKKAISDQLIINADKYKANIDSLKEIVELPENAKEKEKAQKQIPKVEKNLLATQLNSAQINKEINDARYNLYNEKFKQSRINNNTNEARQGKQLEKDANAKYSKAKILREKALINKDSKEVCAILVQAEKLEQNAIEDQEKAFGVYLGLKPIDGEIKQIADVTHNETPVDTTKQIIASNELNNNEKITLVNPPDNNNEANNNSTQNNVVENISNPVDTISAKNNLNETQNNSNVTTDTVKQIVLVDTLSNKNLIVENNNIIPVDTAKNIEVVENIQENNNQINNTIIPPDTNPNKNLVVENNSNNNEINENNNANVSNPINNNNTENNTINHTTVNNPEISDALGKEGFGFSNLPGNAYSNANPIPMNISLPSGVVFKVQIGAFKNPVKNGVFKGINPVTGETLVGSAFVRYYVGLFYSESAANLVRNEIRPLGFNDAFIVAYYNGKKISLFEARRLIKESTTQENYNLLAQAEVEKIKNRTNVPINQTNTTQTENYQNQTANQNQANNQTQANNATVNSTNVNETSDLFYTVQIGVYKNPVTAGDLKNLTPIYQDNAYGFIRYTTGKFSDPKKAINEKNRIVQLGIADAFVSAYYKGKKITLGEAALVEKLSQKNTTTNENTTNENVSYPEPQIPVKQSTTNVINKENIVFKVQIGAFKEQVPVAKVNEFMVIASTHGLDQEKEPAGSVVYSVGKYKTYDEAVKMRDVLIYEGFKDAFIIVYNGKQKISVNEAKSILNQ